MDRRTVSATLLGVLAAGGIASLIGVTAVSDDSPYLGALTWFGLGGSGIGIVGLFLLLFFSGNDQPVEAVRPNQLNQSVTSSNQSGGITARNVSVGNDPSSR